MLRRVEGQRLFLLALLACAVCLFIGAPAAMAAEETEAGGGGFGAAGLGIGAGIAVAGAGLGTARAQAAVGSAGAGALAEKPELFGRIFLLFAIPETIIILGFVIAYLLIGKI